MYFPFFGLSEIVVLLIVIFIIYRVFFRKKVYSKEVLFKNLINKIKQGEITKEEVINQIDNLSLQKPEPKKERKKIPLNKLLYIIGGIIIVIGVILFVVQIWHDLGIIGRMMITLGFGVLMSALGSKLLIKKKESIGHIFYFIGGLFIPYGLVITFYELYSEKIINSLFWPAAGFGLFFVLYLLINLIHKNYLLTFFSIAHGTIAVYLFFSAISKEMSLNYQEVYSCLTMVVGISYFLLARSFEKTWNKGLTKILYFLSPIGFLGGVFSLATMFTAWELAYYFIFLGIALLAVYFKNYLILLINTIYLIVYYFYVFDLRTDYFNFHVTLIILTGLGYLALAHFFKEKIDKRVVYLLEIVGIGSVLYISFHQAVNYFFWELAYFAILIGFAFLAAHLKNYFILVVNTLLFLAYSSYLISGITFFNYNIALIILTGLIYLSLTHFFRETFNKILINYLHFIGMFSILVFSFSEIIGSIPWQIFYFFILITGFILAAHLKSSIILIINTLALVSYIGYITAVHFADSLGWPISLIILGFIFIGLGFASFSFNKKYIKEE